MFFPLTLGLIFFNAEIVASSKLNSAARGPTGSLGQADEGTLYYRYVYTQRLPSGIDLPSDFFSVNDAYVDTVSDLVPVLDEIEAKMARGARPT